MIAIKNSSMFLRVLAFDGALHKINVREIMWNNGEIKWNNGQYSV